MALVYFNKYLKCVGVNPGTWEVVTKYASHIRELPIPEDAIKLSEDFIPNMNRLTYFKLVLARDDFNKDVIYFIITTKDDDSFDYVFIDTGVNGFKIKKSIKTDEDYIGVFLSKKDFTCINKEKILIETDIKNLPLEDTEDLDMTDYDRIGRIGIYKPGAKIEVGYKKKTIYELRINGWEERLL